MQKQRQGQLPKKLPHWLQRLKLPLEQGIKRMGRWWYVRSATEQWLLLIFAGLLILGCVLSLLGTALNGDWLGLLTNLGTGLFGSAVTLFLINILVGNKEKQEAKEQEEAQLKADLVEQLRSKVGNVALLASEQLRGRGWHRDGLLRGAYLREANLAEVILPNADLQAANLREANLQNAFLVYANLRIAHLDGCNIQGADLKAVNLQGAILTYAKLQTANLHAANLQDAELLSAYLQNARLEDADLRGANLNYADLEGAKLRGAVLQGAYLISTNLRGADLREVNLEEADLNEADFDENTILPDGSKWTTSTSTETFTRKKG